MSLPSGTSGSSSPPAWSPRRATAFQRRLRRLRVLQRPVVPQPGGRGLRVHRPVRSVLADRPVRRSVHRPLVEKADHRLRRAHQVRDGRHRRVRRARRPDRLPLYVSALAVLGVNRFFLARSRQAPRTSCGRDKLVMANAVAPTAGTIVGFVGGVVGLGVHLVTGGGLAGSAATLWFAGACYLVAGPARHAACQEPARPGRVHGRRPGGLQGKGQRRPRTQGCLRRPRRRPEAPQQAEKGRLRTRRRRRAPRAVRHAARRGAAALPQLLLLGRQREQGPRQRRPCW